MAENPPSLFDDPSSSGNQDAMPLAARLRPRDFEGFFGQRHLVAPGTAFRTAAEAGKLGSVLFWGPPGVGKTTLAEIVARTTEAEFETVSAVTAGVADLRKIIESARVRRQAGRRTILFIDEIHRFNKAQQDAVLPHVENGTILLIGATTENPSFEVNPALLSRVRTYVLEMLGPDDLGHVFDRAAALEPRLAAEPDARAALMDLANGDARSLLNMIELCGAIAEQKGGRITLEIVKQAVQQRSLRYDKAEQHFDLISALHKSVRDSDVDASLYWLARMLESGEDPLYLARRVLRMASEDIGLADPQALPLCLAAQQTVHMVGMPEGALALAEAVAYLALAPKSNALYRAYGAAVADVHATASTPVPLHLRNAPTRLMKELGFGAGYEYAPETSTGLSAQEHFPAGLEGRRYYEPGKRGHEKILGERLERIRKWVETQRNPNPSSTITGADVDE